MTFFKKLKHIFYDSLRVIKKDLAQTVEEFRAIARNQSYASRYPKLFAIFAVIEHEQSPQVFELKQHEFQFIKNEILHNIEVNNHQILEAIRGLFQNSNLLDFDHEIKNKIAEYLFKEASILVRLNDRYYLPLTKAILRGFPFLLNHDDYAIFKKLLTQKTKISLKIIKFILESDFGNFFVKSEDIYYFVNEAFELENKAVFMLLIRYLRQNNLLTEFFAENKIRFKIDKKDFGKKNIFDILIVALSYQEDKKFESKKFSHEIENFFKEIFSSNLKIAEKKKIYSRIQHTATRATRIGVLNNIMILLLEKEAGFLINAKKDKKKSTLKSLTKHLIKAAEIERPATNIQPRSFFAVSPLAPEEHWLLENASYLL